MNNPVLKLTQRIFGPYFWWRVRMNIVGIAQDFWKDPPKPGSERKPKKPLPEEKGESTSEASKVAPQPSVTNKQKKIWYADRSQVLEKIWGDGKILPGNDDFLNQLLAPLGLNKEKNALDLAAGLGGLARKMVDDFDTYIRGLEPDAALARRGMTMSINAGKQKHAGIEHYDPASFKADKHYDCIVARELFYRVIGKNKFFKAISSGLKSKGQIVFTDYILDPKARKNEVITAWMAHEPEAAPLSMSEMVQAWTELGFDMRVNEDQTPMYKHEILMSLAKFANFLVYNPPDEETKPVVLQEIETWGRRVAAMEHGLKFCRFYAIKV